MRLAPLDLLPEQARGVGQRETTVCRFGPPERPPVPVPVMQLAWGVGHAPSEDEESFAAVRRADARSREESFRNPVTQAFQLASDLAISEVEVIGHVFEENKSGRALGDDARDVGPEMAGIGGAEAFAGDAERLTWIARQDAIHRATPRAAVECSNIVPDRSLRQGRVFHPGHEDGRGIGVPLDITNSPISGFGDVQAEVEPAGAGAEREPEQASPIPVSRIRGGM